jgi:hypothetical protein
LNKDRILIFLRDIMPAIIVFFISIVFLFFIDKVTMASFQQLIVRSIIRLPRFVLFLCLPLYLIFPIYNFIINKMKQFLLRVEFAEPLQIHPFKHWIARPFQGIGIILLFSTKLLISLSIIVGVPESSLFLGSGHFQTNRFLTVTIITVLIAILLSNLWTLDDMGIRFFNRKHMEIKMIGKYVGTLMPIIFGFYGIFTLHTNYPAEDALIYLFKLVIILYPPFLIFAVIHTYLIRYKEKLLSDIPGLRKWSTD